MFILGNTASKKKPAVQVTVGNVTTSLTDTVSRPVHNSGDIILFAGMRAFSTTPPSLPAGWNDITSLGDNSGAFDAALRLCYEVGDGSTDSETMINGHTIAMIVLKDSSETFTFTTADSAGSNNMESPAVTPVRDLGRYIQVTANNNKGTAGSANNTIVNVGADQDRLDIFESVAPNATVSTGTETNIISALTRAWLVFSVIAESI